MLGLLRDGLTNRQIGERLGVSHDAAKYHVGQILSKLGLETREAAAAWQPPAAARVEAARPAWASGLAALLGRLPRVGKATLAAGSAAVLVGVGVLAYGVMSNGGDDEGGSGVEGTETPRETTAPSATEGGLVLDPPAIQLSIGEPAKLQGDVALLMETGCTQCDGPTTGIDRVYYDAGSEYRQEHLYSVAQNNSEPITGFAVSRNGYRLAVSACARGVCADGVFNGAGEDAQSVVRYSDDGGVTWSEMARVDANVRVRAVLDDGRVVVATSLPNDGSEAATTYETLPDGQEVTRPQSASPFLDPIAMPDSRIGWVGRGGTVLDGAGDVLYELPPGGPHNLTGIAFLSDGKGEDLALVSWQANTEDLAPYLTLFGGAGTIRANYAAQRFVQAGAWLNRGQVIVSMPATADMIEGSASAPGDGFTNIPSYLDLATGEIHPMTAPFLDAGTELGRNHVLALATGPFVRISAVASECVDVHEEPDVGSPVVDCLADGVLVVDLYHSSKLVGATPIDGWWDVMTLDRKHGYVRSTEAEAAPIETGPP